MANEKMNKLWLQKLDARWNRWYTREWGENILLPMSLYGGCIILGIVLYKVFN